MTARIMQAAMSALEDAFPTCAIVLLVAPIGVPEGQRVNYVSNADRAYMIAMMKEGAARLEGRAHPSSGHKHDAGTCKQNGETANVATAAVVDLGNARAALEEAIGQLEFAVQRIRDPDDTKGTVAEALEEVRNALKHLGGELPEQEKPAGGTP